MARRVLIVEDAGFMRSLLVDILTSEGFNIVGEAHDGHAGISMFDELRPDLVTMDINMPKLGGREALEAILKFDAAAKVVIISTAGQDEVIKRTLLLGARDFVSKPFKKYQVVDTINRIIKDNGTPQAFMEELVSWFELGEMLLRDFLVEPDVLLEAREAIKRGEAPNLFESLRKSGAVTEQDLRETLDAGHKEVSLSFMMLKTKVVTMAQLRCAFVMMRRQGKKLGFMLMELGFCSRNQIAEAMKLVPPSRFTRAN